MKTKLFLIAALSLGVLSSCNKDDDQPQNGGNNNGNAASCRLTSVAGGSGASSMNFTATYDASKRLTEYSTSYAGFVDGYTFKYDVNGNMTEYVSTSGQSKDINEKAVITWNSGKMSKMELFYDNSGSLEKTDEYVPVYNNGKIVSIGSYEDSSGTYVKTGEFELAYDANGNLTTKTYYSLNNGRMPVSRIKYGYDSKKTTFTISHFMSADYFTLGNVNNITSITYEEYSPSTQNWTVTDNTAFQYTYNTNNYISGMKGLGSVVYTFNYDCN